MAREDVIMELGLDSSKLNAGLAKAESGLEKFRRTAGLATAAAAASFGLLARKGIELAAEITQLAGLSDTNVETFQAQAEAVKRLGIEQDKYADILKDVTERVGEFIATGGGPMKDFFEQVAPLVGITADEFAGLSGDQALRKYVKALEDAEVPHEQMVFYMETMASDAKALLPLYKDNAAALDELAAAARQAGQVMDEDVVAALNQANDALARMDRRTTVVAGTIVAKLLPLFEAIGYGLLGVGDAIRSSMTGMFRFGDAVRELVTVSLAPLNTVLDSLSLSMRAFGEAAKFNFDAAGQLSAQAKERLSGVLDDFAAIPGEFMRVGTEAIADQKAELGDLGAALKERARQINRAWSDAGKAWGFLSQKVEEHSAALDVSTDRAKDNTAAVDEQTEATEENTAAQEANNAAVQEAIDKAEALATARRQAANAEVNSGYNPDLDADYSAEFQRLMKQRGMTAENAQRLAIGNVNARQRRGASSGTGLGGLAGLDATTLNQLGQAFSMLSYQPTGVERAILAAGGTIETPASRQAASDEAAARELAKLIDELERLNNNFERT